MFYTEEQREFAEEQAEENIRGRRLEEVKQVAINEHKETYDACKDNPDYPANALVKPYDSTDDVKVTAFRRINPDHWLSCGYGWEIELEYSGSGARAIYGVSNFGPPLIFAD